MPKPNIKIPPITMLRKFEVRRPTTDDWYPTYEDGTIAVFGSVQRHRTKEGLATYFAKVGCSGADDFSMSVEFCNGSLHRTEAWYKATQKKVLTMAVINQADLLPLGFRRD